MKSSPPSSSENPKEINEQTIVAAFDFDGTLTFKDTLLPFIRFCTGRLNTFIHILGILPDLMGFALGYRTRQQVKELFLALSFANEAYEALQHKGKQFSDDQIDKLLNSEALAKLKWHQDQGHRCILLSATLDIYLVPWAEKMGFQDLICTKLVKDDKGNVTGKIEGNNCWGPEKVERLKRLLGQHKNYLLYAYGDSRGDRELLEYADFPFYRNFVGVEK